MGHEVLYRTYAENVNKQSTQAWGDEHAHHAGWQEGASGLLHDIRWIDHICANYEEAMEYIKAHNKGWYDQLAVKYRECPRIEPSKTLLALQSRRKAEVEKETAYAKAHSVTAFKAEYIGCPQCGSKLKRELLRSEGCPLCRADLRSKTTIETLARYAHNICDLDKQINAEQRKLQEKAVKKSTIKWLVKIEFHT